MSTDFPGAAARKHRRFWEQSCDRLEVYLRELEQKGIDMTARPAAAVLTAERELVVSRLLDAPRALVFKAWTQPEQAARWWGPQGFTTLSCAMDVRPGGGFRLSIRGPDGSVHIKCGVYREIVAPERLVFTFAWEDPQGRLGHETVITVTFAAEGERTRLTLHQTMFETVEARDSHRTGWTSCLQRFADYLAEAR